MSVDDRGGSDLPLYFFHSLWTMRPRRKPVRRRDKIKVERYRIRWIVNAVRLGKRGKRSINLGFCKKDKKVAFISILGVENVYEFAKPFVVGDVYVNQECEDGKYCWNVECPHNRATPKTLKKYLRKNETLESVAKKLQELGEHFINKIDWNEEGALVYNKAPIILSFKRKDETK